MKILWFKELNISLPGVFKVGGGYSWVGGGVARFSSNR